MKIVLQQSSHQKGRFWPRPHPAALAYIAQIQGQLSPRWRVDRQVVSCAKLPSASLLRSPLFRSLMRASGNMSYTCLKSYHIMVWSRLATLVPLSSRYASVTRVRSRAFSAACARLQPDECNCSAQPTWNVLSGVRLNQVANKAFTRKYRLR